MTIREKTLELIADLAIVNQSDICDEDTLANLGIDSLKSVELIVALEDALHINFDDSDLDPSILTTVQSIINLVNNYASK